MSGFVSLVAGAGSQIIRPDSTVTSNVAGASGDYTAIDEATASDADYIYAKKNDATSQYRMGMANPALPVPSGSYILRYRAVNAQDTTPSGTPFITLGISIYEGVTLRASTTQVLTASLTDYTWTPDLSGVTNFNNLEIDLTQDAQANRNFLVTWLEQQIPAS